jgi:hypothetical protein
VEPDIYYDPSVGRIFMVINKELAKELAEDLDHHPYRWLSTQLKRAVALAK